MPDIFFRKAFGALRPLDEVGEDFLAAIPNDAIVGAKISRPRNSAHHRWFFKLLSVVQENQDHYKTTEELLFALKIRLGLVDEIVLKGGEVHLKPKSISFAAMDQLEFQLFADAVVKFIVTEVIPGMDSAELEREVEELLAT